MNHDWAVEAPVAHPSGPKSRLHECVFLPHFLDWYPHSYSDPCIKKFNGSVACPSWQARATVTKKKKTQILFSCLKQSLCKSCQSLLVWVLGKQIFMNQLRLSWLCPCRWEPNYRGGKLSPLSAKWIAGSTAMLLVFVLISYLDAICSFWLFGKQGNSFWFHLSHEAVSLQELEKQFNVQFNFLPKGHDTWYMIQGFFRDTSSFGHVSFVVGHFPGFFMASGVGVVKKGIFWLFLVFLANPALSILWYLQYPAGILRVPSTQTLSHETPPPIFDFPWSVEYPR